MRTAYAVPMLVVSLALGGAVRGEVFRQIPAGDLSDGVEIADSLWWNNGIPEFQNALAAGFLSDFRKTEPAFIYALPGFARSDTVAYARLRFSAHGGTLHDSLHIVFRGLQHTTGQPFGGGFRPSRVPPTEAFVPWPQDEAWEHGPKWDPYYVFSPDLGPLLNEILHSALWPAAPGVGYFALSMEVADSSASFPDAERFADTGWHLSPTVLEVYRTVEDAFSAPPLIGRVTDHSAAVHFAHLLPLDCYLAYGTESGNYQWAQGDSRTELPQVNPIQDNPGGTPREIRLDDLGPGTRYYVRLYFRRTGTVEFHTTTELVFTTQRSDGSVFRFDLTSDPHLDDKMDDEHERDRRVYRTALQNVALDDADFVLDLGDFALNIGGSNAVRSQEEARRIYSDERAAMGEAGLSAPFYLVLGNHEAELGWLSPDSLGPRHWATRARREYVPNPSPDGFYTGNAAPDPLEGLLQDYYSWEWGDALFVVLDPFRFTTVKPHRLGGGGSMDGWDWTLGREQYDWLDQVLASSQKRWKFVFIHHLVGGILEPVWGPYGRGGIEAVRYSVAGRPSFEWGGEDLDGTYRFAEKRPGWEHGDIHSLLLSHGVSAVFHGHDHGYVFQELDGIVYQECPVPSSSWYDNGLLALAGYENGIQLPNSGHLRLTVSPEDVLVEYVRAFLPGEGENGHVEFSYRITAGGSAAPELPTPRSLARFWPNPCAGRIWITLPAGGGTAEPPALFDASGRLRSVLPRSSVRDFSPLLWDLRDPNGRPLPSGVYQLRWPGREKEPRRVLILR